MVFSDSTNKLGLIEEINRLCDTDSVSYPTADKTSRVNNAYEQVTAWILNADGTWQYDDTNYTNVPEPVTDLVEGQSDYSFAASFLEIDWVKIKDANGHWHLIGPIDQSQTGRALEEYLIVNGMPIGYDKLGDMIRLYPAPKATVVTLSGGMKVGLNRTASIFTASDTTKAPGFASPFHVILAYMASIPYCMAYKKDRVSLYSQTIATMKADLLAFYGHRERDKRKVLTSKPIGHR